MRRFKIAMAMAALMTAPAAPAAPDEFAAIIADFEAFTADQNVIRAGRRGDLEAAARWPDMSPEAMAARRDARSALLARLQAVDAGALNADEQASYAVLEHLLEGALSVPARRQQMISFRPDSGFHTFPDFVARTTRLRSVPAAEAWIARRYSC